MTIIPRLRIGWTQTCRFTGSYDDVSADVLSCRWATGFEEPLLSRIARGGVLEFILDNTENNQWGVAGMYSDNNPASPLYGDIAPNRPVCLDFYKDGTWYTKWVGWLEDLDDDGDPCSPRVKGTAHDGMQPLLDDNITMPIYDDIASDELAYEILVRSAIPYSVCGTWLLGIPDACELGIATILADDDDVIGHDFDDGRITFPYAGDWSAEGVSPWQMLKDVAEAEWGRFFVDPATGRYVFWNNQHEIVETAIDGTITDDHIIAARRFGSIRDIKNSITVSLTPRAVGDPLTTIATLRTTPQIKPGETLEFSLMFRDDVGGNIVGALAIDGYDLEGNDQADGGGTDRSTLLDLDYDVEAARVVARITNISTKKTFYITLLTFTGTPLYRYDTMSTTAENQDSINLYQRRPLPLTLFLGLDYGFAQALAGNLLDFYDLPESYVKFVTVVNLNDECEDLILDLSLMSRIQLESVRLNTDAPHFIIREEGVVMDGGNRVEVMWFLENIAWAEYWILGDPVYGLLGLTTILGPF